MDIGKLRHRLLIQTPSEAQDAMGQAIKTFADTAQRWGFIQPLSGRELERARQISPDVTHKILLRYYSGLNTKHRIKYGTRYFNISAVINSDERNEETEVLAIEKV